MNRFDFTPYRRNTVGFDRLFELLENTGRIAQNENYPPFNIERTGENDYQVTVAVAGFKPDEIEITAQQNLLVVTGSKQADSNDNRDSSSTWELRAAISNGVFNWPTTSTSRMPIWLMAYC